MWSWMGFGMLFVLTAKVARIQRLVMKRTILLELSGYWNLV